MIADKRPGMLFPRFAALIVAGGLATGTLPAAAPQSNSLDFTRGAKPAAQTDSVPLKLPGIMGILNVPDDGGKAARQIYISAVEKGATSAALQVGDVILGTDGALFDANAIEASK